MVLCCVHVHAPLQTRTDPPVFRVCSMPLRTVATNLRVPLAPRLQVCIDLGLVLEPNNLVMANAAIDGVGDCCIAHTRPRCTPRANP